METLVIDNGYKKIAINNEDGELVTVLRINVADAELPIKFTNIINKLNKLESDYAAKANEIKIGGKNIDVIQLTQFKVSYITDLMAEIDDVFGRDTCKNVYGDIIPDELMLLEFIEKLVPIMNNLLAKRIEINAKKYNSKRLGAR